jgi:hypothetical protein
MVHTGAMVSSMMPGISKARVQPGDVQARGVIGTVGYVRTSKIYFEK